MLDRRFRRGDPTSGARPQARPELPVLASGSVSDRCPPCGWSASRPAAGAIRVGGSGVMVCPAAAAAAWSAFYAGGVETLTFLFTDIEGSTALLRSWPSWATRTPRCSAMPAGGQA